MSGIEQLVGVDDEVAHVRVVDRGLRLGLPGAVGAVVVRVGADEVDLVRSRNSMLSTAFSSPPITSGESWIWGVTGAPCIELSGVRRPAR
jgi:hypothetical protein